MERPGTRRAVVIGGGLAGLSAAARLSGAGWHATVLEQEGEVGGRCRTARSGDFLFDTGAQHFHDSYDDTLAAAISNGLGGSFRIPGEPKGLYHDGRLSRFVPRDLNPAAAFPWKAVGREGLLDAVSIGAKLLRGYRGYNPRFPFWWSNGDDRSAIDFLSRRSSSGYRHIVAEPVSLYAAGAGLDALSLSGYMVALRYTFLDRTGGFTSGMGSLPAALAARSEIIPGLKATEVVREGRLATGVRVKPADGGRARTLEADFVICALPAPSVQVVTGRLGNTARRVIRETAYSPAVVVNLAYGEDPAGPGGPILLPREEGFRASWICAGSSKAADYAPEGSSVLSAVFCGDEAKRLLEEPDGGIEDLARADAARIYETGSLAPLAARVDRHLTARPIVSPGHASRVKALRRDGSGVSNMALAGDWTASPTVEGAISSGVWAADFALARADSGQ